MAALAALSTIAAACARPAAQPPEHLTPSPSPRVTPSRSPRATAATAAAWTRGGVCYEVFIRSFYDSNGDGVGDLNGLIDKLDYINDGNPASTHDLGADCIWLMPVTASPSYHGYDVSDYYRVEPAYGTNADFKRLVAE
ncbi:MAG TPA: alpha-amylase family glycosyl hydrolase, partial [Gemmatimonadaceae bacterium]